MVALNLAKSLVFLLEHKYHRSLLLIYFLEISGLVFFLLGFMLILGLPQGWERSLDRASKDDGPLQGLEIGKVTHKIRRGVFVIHEQNKGLHLTFFC